MVIHRVGGRCLHPLDEEILPGNRPDNTELGGRAPKSSLNMLAADSQLVIEVDALGACGRSPERADRFESTPCQADGRPFRRSEMADLACGRASRRVPNSFYRRRPRDRRLLPQAPRFPSEGEATGRSALASHRFKALRRNSFTSESLFRASQSRSKGDHLTQSPRTTESYVAAF